MKRRQFLAIPALAMTAKFALAEGANQVEYTREAYEQALTSGEPFMLSFTSTW
jgi:hypothetical protein